MTSSTGVSDKELRTLAYEYVLSITYAKLNLIPNGLVLIHFLRFMVRMFFIRSPFICLQIGTG